MFCQVLYEKNFYFFYNKEVPSLCFLWLVKVTENRNKWGMYALKYICLYHVRVECLNVGERFDGWEKGVEYTFSCVKMRKTGGGYMW